MNKIFRILGRLSITLAFMLMLGPSQAASTAYNFDFGPQATLQSGYMGVDETTKYTAQLGYGWLALTNLSTRDRLQPDALRRDFVLGTTSQTFRIAGLAPGLYLLTVVSGDLSYGDHDTQVSIGTTTMPAMTPATSQFMTLTATITVPATGYADIKFTGPQNNWVVNTLSFKPATTAQAAVITQETILTSTWAPILTWPDPTKPLLDQFIQAEGAKAPATFSPTGLNRADYLKLITSEIDFWKTYQDANGAIIDPYKQAEWQYSTPAFACAAAGLVAWNKRTDLLEPAAKAMDWATLCLSQRKAATGHEDFYPPMLAHAMPLLKPYVTVARYALWESEIRGIVPTAIYRVAPGGSNWNMVSLSGEALFQLMGLRDPNSTYVSVSLAAQGVHFGSPYGLYLEGPMAYDHFPRLWTADMLAHGYSGPLSAELTEALRRAAITSLFMQSSWGELPAGGRSAQHQWNEAEQCATYEIYAAQSLHAGDELMAGVYERAAHLALASMRRWVRPSGEMQIVKNWMDPAQRFAFESYSAHSQYNLLPAAMLAIAYEQSATTTSVAELPAPADIGGYVMEIPELHKVFANAGGTYVEIDTAADHSYDATGLIRVHSPAISPQLGLGDSVVTAASYQSPQPSPVTTGVGASWKDTSGIWRTLGELSANDITKRTVTPLSSTPDQVAFDIAYTGSLLGVSSIIEHYVVTPGGVKLTTELPNYSGPLRYVWPVLADDGRTTSAIAVSNGTVSVTQDSGRTAETFTPLSASSVRVETPNYSNHNGLVRLAYAEYPQGGSITLLISPVVKTTHPNIDALTPVSSILYAATDPPLSLTLTGSGFVSGTLVSFDGQTLTPASLSTTSLIVSVPASLLAAAHTASVLLINPCSQLSNAMPFPIGLFTVTGVVSLQGWTGAPQPLTFTLTPTGSTAGRMLTQPITLGSDGTFTLSSVPAGTYTLGIKGSKWLRKNLTISIASGNVTGLSATLLAGDVNNDNQITGTDLAIVRKAYGSTSSSANWNVNADLNGDGQVTMIDLSILRANYGKNGD